MTKRVYNYMVPLLLALVMMGCAGDNERSYSGLEAEALDGWMAKYHPELLNNKQEEGGYYVDILDAGDASKPVNDTIYWVRLEFTGRDLKGNICLTRDEKTARQVGSFTKYTHYIPLYRYCGEEEANLIDGLQLLLRNSLKLDADYAAARGLDEELTLGLGGEAMLYMPSTIVGGLSGSGGYEGQAFSSEGFALSKNRPLVAHVKVVDLVKNPLKDEGEAVDTFGAENGTVKPVEQPEEEDDKSTTTRGAEEPQYNDGYSWRTANDSLPQLYINHTFKPSIDAAKLFNYRNTYRSEVAPYNDMQALDLEINRRLIDRFGEGRLDGDSVKMDGKAKIWYIGRFLDGFIFDTNIDEVKELIYGKVESKGDAITITPEDDKSKYVDSWYFSIPQLRYGQWAAIMGTSTYNYGVKGQAGETTTSTTYDQSYYDMMNYYNMMNSYYGNSYYGGYYGGYYDYYNYGYYNNYNMYNTNYESTTTTTISTEIQAYTPLLFQIYIEEK